MGKKLRLSLLAASFLSSLLPAVTGSAATAPSTLLQIHCGTEVGRTCDQALTGIRKVFNDRVRQQVAPKDGQNGYYRRKDLLQTPRAGSDPLSGRFEVETRQADFPQACSLNGNRFNGDTAEKETSHLGDSCGEPDRVACRTGSTGELRAQLLMNSGDRESAYLHGAYIEALACVLQEMGSQMTRDQELKLAGDDTTTNSCLTLFGPYADARLRLIQDAEKAKRDGTPLCRFTEDGLPEQAGCYASAALQALDALFTAMAACETFRRADEAFEAYRVTVASPEARRRFWLEQGGKCAKTSKSCLALEACHHEGYRTLLAEEAKKRFSEENKGGKCGLP